MASQAGMYPSSDTAVTSLEQFALSTSQLSQLQAYRDLVLDWNQRFNLTAITEPEAVDALLIGESLRLLPAIDAFAVEHDRFSVLDIGTGAGIPGIPLAIARPEWRVTLLDATRKKVDFLHNVIEELGLRHTRAIHGRAEEVARDLDHRIQYDAVVARAVSSLPALAELALPFLRTGGRAYFPKGTDIDSELAEAKTAVGILGGRIVSADLLDVEAEAKVTRLVVIAKIRATPERYPRRAGIPAKEPLGRVGR